MQESDFFRHPIGTGPYKLTEWDEGQAIILDKNEDYFKGEPNIDEVIFKIVTDDNAKALQMDSGELDLALLTPKDAQNFTDKEGYTCYDMKTSDYRGILFNFNNDYWTENKDIIPAICYGIDREAIVQAVLLGEGMPAYGPLQRNIYNDENVEHYDYNPEKAKEILESVGCTMGDDGFYYRKRRKTGLCHQRRRGRPGSCGYRSGGSPAAQRDRHRCDGRGPGSGGLGRTDGLPHRLGKPL